jgi:hypothetical protein
MKRFCPSLNIESAIRNWSNSSNVKNWKDEHGRTLCIETARLYLGDCLSRGIKWLAFERCDNFDPNRGCLGHEEVKR